MPHLFTHVFRGKEDDLVECLSIYENALGCCGAMVINPLNRFTGAVLPDRLYHTPHGRTAKGQGSD